ncbi:hypothetical protein GCM10023176_40500 [Micromonospora coerulea]|uniref:Uncharacterized protein n=1 Tax=Micromonospora coerulea TaxID=47856 RepID=A0ABP8SST1_9ACTN
MASAKSGVARSAQQGVPGSTVLTLTPLGGDAPRRHALPASWHRPPPGGPDSDKTSAVPGQPSGCGSGSVCSTESRETARVSTT